MAIALRPIPHNDHYALPGYSTPHREPMARHGGRDDTLHWWTPPRPRDLDHDDQPYNEGRGMFSRLHEGAS